MFLLKFIVFFSFTFAADNASEFPFHPVTAADDQISRVPHWTNMKAMMKQVYAEPAGSKVALPCRAAGAEPLHASWYTNGEKIDKSGRVGGYKFRREGQTLVFDSVVRSDSGRYMCIINNTYGSINHTFELDIYERLSHRPIIRPGFLHNKSAEVGGEVRFECRVLLATPPVHIQWFKKYYKRSGNGSIADSPYVKVLQKSGDDTSDVETLTLHNVTSSDEGEYTCIAGNAIGFSHASAWLTVLSASSLATTAAVVMIQVPPSRESPHVALILLIPFLVVLVMGMVGYFVHRKRYREIPRLVAIENPDRIPPLTHLEEPILLMSGDSAWCRLRPTDVQLDLQWELKQENIHLIRKIDEGFFGVVYLAEVTSGSMRQQEAAVKMLKATNTEKDVLDLLSEMDQMKRVGKHKNIINLLGVCTQNGVLWLVTEYAQQGNLRDYLRRNRPLTMQYHLVDPTAPAPRGEPLSQKNLMSASYQVARGMEYLSQKKCVHRDLAARNVLVTSDYVMKIADFGLARDIRSHDYYRKHTRGHLPYKWMALESLTDNVFSTATDVWSFGVLLWEIFSLGGSPYPGVKTHDLVRLLRMGERLDHPQFASFELYRLMRDCWEETAQRRPKFRQLVEDLDRMLAESSPMDYIDLSRPIAAVCELSDTDESGIHDRAESRRGSSHEAGSDSVFDPSIQMMHNDPEDGPLLHDGVI